VDISQLRVAHAHTQGNPKGVTWSLVTSGSHGTIDVTEPAYDVTESLKVP
jgi:hypothetical protein